MGEIDNEDGLVQDAYEVFKYIKSKSGDSPVFVWCHSLGTGIGLNAVQRLCNEGLSPDGLVL